MDYNWQEIFKEKSDRELFQIYKGRTTLQGEPQKFAEMELNNRGFNFNDLTKYKAKSELLSLIEEEKSTDGLFGRPSAFMLGFMKNGLYLFVCILVLIAVVNWDSMIESDSLYGIGIIILFMTLLALLMSKSYRKAKIREAERKKTHKSTYK